MRWIKNLLIGFLVIIFSCVYWPVSATDGKSINFDVEALNRLKHRKDYQNYSVEEFQTAIKALKEIEQYELRVTLSNDQTNHKMAELLLYGNQQTEDLRGTVNYFYPDRTPNEYSFNFITYDDFRLVYTQPIQYLNSMAFFQQEGFHEEFRQELMDYQDVYVETPLSTDKSKRRGETSLEALFYLPDFDRLKETDANIHQLTDKRYTAYMELIEIPDLLFNRSGNFEFIYTLNPTFNWNSKKEQWRVDFEQGIDLNEAKNRGIQFNLTTATDFSKTFSTDEPEFSRISNIDTSLVGSKMTRVHYSFDPRNNHYQATVAGISENVNLNLDLFGSEPANFRAYNLRIDYRLKPIESEFPTVESLETMSNQEFNYVIEQLFNKYHEKFNDEEHEQLSSE